MGNLNCGSPEQQEPWKERALALPDDDESGILEEDCCDTKDGLSSPDDDCNPVAMVASSSSSNSSDSSITMGNNNNNDKRSTKNQEEEQDENDDEPVVSSAEESAEADDDDDGDKNDNEKELKDSKDPDKDDSHETTTKDLVMEHDDDDATTATTFTATTTWLYWILPALLIAAVARVTQNDFPIPPIATHPGEAHYPRKRPEGWTRLSILSDEATRSIRTAMEQITMPGSSTSKSRHAKGTTTSSSTTTTTSSQQQQIQQLDHLYYQQTQPVLASLLSSPNHDHLDPQWVLQVTSTYIQAVEDYHTQTNDVHTHADQLLSVYDALGTFLAEQQNNNHNNANNNNDQVLELACYVAHNQATYLRTKLERPRQALQVYQRHPACVQVDPQLGLERGLLALQVYYSDDDDHDDDDDATNQQEYLEMARLDLVTFLEQQQQRQDDSGGMADAAYRPLTEVLLLLQQATSDDDDTIAATWQLLQRQATHAISILQPQQGLSAPPSQQQAMLEFYHRGVQLHRLHATLFFYYAHANAPSKQQALAHLRAACRYKTAALQSPWRTGVEANKIQQTQKIFGRPEFWQLPTGLRTTQPVLVVGFYNSGVDEWVQQQLLLQHPNNNSVRQVPQSVWQDSLTPLRTALGAAKDAASTMSTTQEWAERIWQRLQQESGSSNGQTNVQYILDFNEYHAYTIGMWHFIFPDAPIVHVYRPGDAVLSHLLEVQLTPAGPMPETRDYACDPAALVELYQSYREIMDHWDRVLPAGRITHVAASSSITTSSLPGLSAPKAHPKPQWIPSHIVDNEEGLAYLVQPLGERLRHDIPSVKESSSGHSEL